MIKYLASVSALACLTAPMLAPTVALAQNQPATDHSGADDGMADTKLSWKYFFFHNAAVSEDQARSDVIECYGYSRGLVVQKAGGTQTYSSVPYTATSNLSPLAAGAAGAIGGLVGGIIVGFMDAGDRRAMERTNLRKCFAFKGYDRYEISKEEHTAMMDGEQEEVRERIIARVTGDAPSTERLVR